MSREPGPDEHDDAELRSLLEDWVTRSEPVKFPPETTAVAAYFIALDQVITILNATRNDGRLSAHSLPVGDDSPSLDADALAEALHEAMCDVSHHDRPPARCSRWSKYPAIARSVVTRYRPSLEGGHR